MFQQAHNVVLCVGAVQSARILLMSGPPGGLGNGNGLVGRNAMFHTFGLGSRFTLPEQFTGFLHSEFGHTGTVLSFNDYFVSDEIGNGGNIELWLGLQEKILLKMLTLI
ncbi:hypothetical protein IK7_05611 [Bacillus cereus VD156]|nr:hypothetical protein IK7_05611 [Bacillus cereus VD156]